MNKLISFIILILIVIDVTGQSITSSRSDIYKSYVTKHDIPKRIFYTNTFYNKSGKEIKTEFIEFSENLDTIIEKRYKNKELDAELVFIFNKDKKLISRSFKRKVALVGWQYEMTKYSYDSLGLNQRASYDINDNLINKAVFTNDSLGNQIKMMLFKPNGALFGFESAEYNYIENNWIHRVHNFKGDLISEKEYKIKAVENEDRKYNENGDCILYPRNWNDSDDVFYKVEYSYDYKDNWIDQKIYSVKLVNGKLKRKKIDRFFKRTIEYRN